MTCDLPSVHPGVEPVTSEHRCPSPDGKHVLLYTFADFMDLDPPALFSERRAMSKMGPVRLALHLLSRTVYFAGVKGHYRRNSWAMRAWLALWRAERRTWPT
jgi:hypothetical protein